ncbi:hypothetical protein BJV78DRAFT_293984 [Lactifluus subvellereus]|nr:hypothetical protein BJV78DRAFT_293984 [Lactifluus subvellereus]
MSAIGAARGSVLRNANSLPKGLSNVHIKLTGLPRTTTPVDITRLLGRNKVHNIKKGGDHAVSIVLGFRSTQKHLDAVTLEYHRFEPTGSAFLTLTQPSVLPKALAVLKQLRFFGHPLTPRATSAPAETRMRSRGLKGAKRLPSVPSFLEMGAKAASPTAGGVCCSPGCRGESLRKSCDGF